MQDGFSGTHKTADGAGGGEYGELLKNTDFSDENLLKEARRIAAMDMIYRNLEGFLAGSPGDVETMLFYDRPLEAFYDSLQEQGLLLLNGVVEALNGFLTDTRRHIHEVWIQEEPAPAEEIQKAQEFFAMEREIERETGRKGRTGDGRGRRRKGGRWTGTLIYGTCFLPVRCFPCLPA